jgi:hypothetical protein
MGMEHRFVLAWYNIGEKHVGEWYISPKGLVIGDMLDVLWLLNRQKHMMRMYGNCSTLHFLNDTVECMTTLSKVVIRVSFVDREEMVGFVEAVKTVLNERYGIVEPKS